MAMSSPMNHGNATVPDVDPKVFTIAGIRTSVYGLEWLPDDGCEVACLWLLHPRLQTQSCMRPIAAQALDAWEKTRLDSGSRVRLIAVSFDQRNHGSRKIDETANGAWRDGNPLHAQDMFSIYNGTAQDTTLLLTYLPSYVFPAGRHMLTTNIVLGVSLGGHAAWHCVLHDPRITAAVVVIGCPDYIRLMTDRAAKSKLRTWASTKPPGANFLGSSDFPRALLDALTTWDPACVLGTTSETSRAPSFGDVSFLSRCRQKLNSKWILNLSGGADKLVPYDAGKPFLDRLKSVAKESKNINLEDLVFDGVGHQFTHDMAESAVAFICSYLSKPKKNEQISTL